jgi:hypothetical protein
VNALSNEKFGTVEFSLRACARDVADGPFEQVGTAVGQAMWLYPRPSDTESVPTITRDNLAVFGVPQDGSVQNDIYL